MIPQKEILNLNSTKIMLSLKCKKKPHDEEAEDDFGEVEIPSITSFFFVIGD